MRQPRSCWGEILPRLIGFECRRPWTLSDLLVIWCIVTHLVPQGVVLFPIFTERLWQTYARYHYRTIKGASWHLGHRQTDSLFKSQCKLTTNENQRSTLLPFYEGESTDDKGTVARLIHFDMFIGVQYITSNIRAVVLGLVLFWLYYRSFWMHEMHRRFSTRLQ